MSNAKLIISAIFFAAIFMFLPIETASADTCQSENGAVVDDFPYNEANRQGACQTPASYYEFFFKTFLVCEGFPILPSLSNCQDIKITPTAVKIKGDSSTSMDGLLPLPGTYTYSVSTVSPVVKVAGAVTFESVVLAGAAPGTDSWSSGRYCQQKPGNFIFSEVVAESYDWHTGNTYCRSTPFTEAEITPSTITLDDFLLVGSQYRATNHPTFDPSQDFNAVAITSDNQIAQAGSEVESLFLVQKLAQPVNILPSHNTIEFTYSLEQGLANSRSCTLGGDVDDLDSATCLLTWFWMGGTNTRFRTY